MSDLPDIADPEEPPDDVRSIEAELDLPSDNQDDTPLVSSIQADQVRDLPSAQALSADEAYLVTAANSTRLVVLAGLPGSGKTTLISMVYELLLRGPFAGFAFAGSRTLVGFEERSYLARTTSDMPKPDTRRTRTGDPNYFLHLELNQGKRSSEHILFADLSGEHYREASNNPEDCRHIGILSRADHLAVLVDGAILCDEAKRHSACADSEMLVQSCVDCGHLNGTSSVQVLFTKWDLCIHDPLYPEQADPIIQAFEHSFRKKFGDRIGTISFHKVAARPESPSSDIGNGFGLSGLMMLWVQSNEKESAMTSRDVNIGVLSEFDAFAFRQSDAIGEGLHA